ncbi:MAG: stage II sporulation protein R [Acutalibacteraceae bacterium]
MFTQIFKPWEKALALGLIVTIALSCISFSAECENIREDVLRLHILANSDSEKDQQLKLKVRDEILKISGDIFDGCKSLADAQNAAKQKMPQIIKTAQDTVKSYGYDYTVSASLAKSYFDTRHYDNYTLPAGIYNAVRVIIGNGNGHNWWCVMYPSLCLPAACDNYDTALDENERDIVENYPKYEIKFKSVEIFEWLKSKL